MDVITMLKGELYCYAWLIFGFGMLSGYGATSLFRALKQIIKSKNEKTKG